MGKSGENKSKCIFLSIGFRIFQVCDSNNEIGFFFRFWQKSPSGHGNVEEAWKSFLVQELVTCLEKDIPIHFLMEMPTLTWSRLWWRDTSHSCLLKFLSWKFLCNPKGIFNPLHPKINIHILHTFLFTFAMVLTRRISLTIGIFQWKFFT